MTITATPVTDQVGALFDQVLAPDEPDTAVVKDGMVDNTTVGEVAVGFERGFRTESYTLHMGGQPHRRTRNLAAAAILRDRQQSPSEVLARSSVGVPVSMLMVSSSTGTVRVVEGKIVEARQSEIVFLPKGARRNGYRFPLADIVDVVGGYGAGQELANTFVSVRREFVPATVKAHFDAIPAFDPDGDGENTLIAAVFLFDHGIRICLRAILRGG
jgi:hypothetical protein